MPSRPVPSAPDACRSTLAQTEQAVAHAAVRYDRTGDQHYDVAWRLIKSMRGSDVDAALHYLARMLEAGEDPRFIARRMVIAASRGRRHGRPDGAADRGRRDARRGADRHARGAHHPRPGRRPPRHWRRSPTPPTPASTRRSPTSAPGAAARCPRTCATRTTPGPPLGHGQGYVYAHDEPDGVVAAAVPPRRPRRGTDYYRPTDRGVRGPARRSGWSLAHAQLRPTAGVGPVTRAVTTPAIRPDDRRRRRMTVTLGGDRGAHRRARVRATWWCGWPGLLRKLGQVLDETTVSLRTTSDNVQPTLQGPHRHRQPDQRPADPGRRHHELGADVTTNAVRPDVARRRDDRHAR